VVARLIIVASRQSFVMSAGEGWPELSSARNEIATGPDKLSADVSSTEVPRFLSLYKLCSTPVFSVLCSQNRLL